MRKVTSVRDDVDATFIFCTQKKLPLIWRASVQQVRHKGDSRFLFSPIFARRFWGREWMRENWHDDPFDAVVVAPQNLGLGFTELLPPDIPMFVATDFTFRLPLRHGRCVFAHDTGEMLERRIFERAARVFPMSRWVADALIEDYRIPARRVDVVPPSLCVDDYDARSRDPDTGMLRIGFVGNPFADKGGTDLVEVHQRHFKDRAHLEIVSRGFRPSREFRNITHWPMVEHDRLFREIIPRWDIFCLPTHHDMSPWVVAEAHAVGLPAVTTRTGGIPEICVDGETGFLIDPRDREALVARLATLVENRDLREKMGRAARVHARKNLNASINYNRMIDDIVAEVKPARPDHDVEKIPAGLASSAS
jgi:glycosyltransferase involved in cell wall biosynthesis